MTKEPTQSVALIQKDITDDVNIALTKLQEEGLALPTNYNYSNALKSAFFALSNNAGGNLLEICSKASIANALLDMVTQGLSPAKTQCYFINYNKTCKLNRSYFGTQAVLKRLTNVKDIWANVIYQDDVFDYENDRGREKLVSHKTAFENRDKNIIGAYAVIQTTDDEELLTVMTRKEFEASWSQSKTQQAVHKKFPQEMAKRTVINRAAKAFINTSDDSDLLVQAINNSTEAEYDNERKEVGPQEEINEKANTEMIDFAPEPVISKPNINQETGEIIEPEPPKQDIYTEPEPLKTAASSGPGW
ncbi:recombinase RecT [Sporosarcina sp. FA9]|uniref:recombinase RecT n=1 Tax=Sporosarcina sp. FA9 TaxID=3413030 RepID=UPI003F65A6E4